MINNIPPKQTVGGPPVAPPLDAGVGYERLPPPLDPSAGQAPQHGLILHGDAAHGDANAFPVLKAFQDYLEMERQQARKRLVTLTVFFVTLMTLVVAGFIVAFIYLFSNMSRREDALLQIALQQKRTEPDAGAQAAGAAQQAVRELQATLAAQQQAARESQATLAAQQAARETQAAAQALLTNVGTQVASMGSMATKINSQVAEQNAEMNKLREALASMKTENDRLRTDLPKLALDAARRVPAPPAAPPATWPAAGNPGSVPAAPLTPAAGADKAPKGYDEVVLPLRTRDSDTTIPWRIPLPK